MKVQEAIKKINDAVLYDMYEALGCLDLAKKPEVLAENLNKDKFRWFLVADNYYKMDDGILGLRGVTHVYSEMMTTEDCGMPVQAFAGEKFTTISYRSKEH